MPSRPFGAVFLWQPFPSPAFDPALGAPVILVGFQYLRDLAAEVVRQGVVRPSGLSGSETGMGYQVRQLQSHNVVPLRLDFQLPTGQVCLENLRTYKVGAANSTYPNSRITPDRLRNLWFGSFDAPRSELPTSSTYRRYFTAVSWARNPSPKC